jgi:hypothetical protein
MGRDEMEGFDGRVRSFRISRAADSPRILQLRINRPDAPLTGGSRNRGVFRRYLKT